MLEHEANNNNNKYVILVTIILISTTVNIVDIVRLILIQHI